MNPINQGSILKFINQKNKGYERFSKWEANIMSGKEDKLITLLIA
jgi:hypothetical protein